MQVVGLDVEIPDDRFFGTNFGSSTSIFDFDVVIWNPTRTLRLYPKQPFNPTYQGLPSLSEDASSNIQRDMQRRANEFREFIEMGRTLVVSSAPPVLFYRATGETRTSGTGRNQKVTIIVKETNLLSVLPYEFESEVADGERITACDERFSEILRRHSGWWSFGAILKIHPGTPLAVVSGTTKVVGSIAKYENGATVIHLPDHVILDWESFSDHVHEDDPETEDLTDREELGSDLLDWIRDVSSVEASELPEWLESLQFHEDVSRAAKVKAIDAKLSKLSAELSGVQQERAKDNQWKQLVVASGDVLESAVEAAFKVIGFEVLEKVPGRRDLRLKAGNAFAVVEVKGVSKSGSETNAAQLEKWVNEAFIEHSVHHKGILVVNTWRNLPLNERTQADFPDQMLPYSIARGHVLITGLQLLGMVRAVLASRSSREDLQARILATTGLIDGWDDYTESFVPPMEQVDASREA